MQCSWEIRIFSAVFICNNLFGINEAGIFERELQSYSRDCHNRTCNYKLSVDLGTNTATYTTETPFMTNSLVNEMMRLKVRS